MEHFSYEHGCGICVLRNLALDVNKQKQPGYKKGAAKESNPYTYV